MRWINMERGTCPSNLKWLKAMHEILPKEVFERSKLAIYLHCIEESEKNKEVLSQ
jgi:hypothetical protein